MAGNSETTTNGTSYVQRSGSNDGGHDVALPRRSNRLTVTREVTLPPWNTTTMPEERLYEIDEEEKKSLAEHEELFNLEDGADEAFVMEEKDDDELRRQRASHSRRVMQVVGQISKPRRAANLDRKREIRGLRPEQKTNDALRRLAYGAFADQVDEIMRMEKSTVLESLMWFCSTIEALNTNEYFWKPTTMDLRRLLKQGEMHDFPSMIGGIDCIPRAPNDLNVFAQSPVFDEVLQGKTPKVTY
ncbi:uncharacterized protein [Pyrus communis]|uniref:uncharacterized protein n=1 Tax=Pyrus communis TaxID=23211 RepID=UPI0035BFD339